VTADRPLFGQCIRGTAEERQRTGSGSRIGAAVTDQVAFLFDMDGTIADTMPFHLQAWMELLGELGNRMSPQEFLRKTSGKMNHQILNGVLGMALSTAELARFEARKESRFRELCRDRLRPILGLVAFLEESRRSSVALAVATAAGKENRDLVLEGLGIASAFRVVIGAEDVRNGKPDPEIFLKAAGGLQVDPARCVVFEDAVAGVEAAGRAGMKAVALTTSLDAREFQGHPAVIRIAKDYTSLRPQTLVDAVRHRV
jgi:beta-phosphoglucomutase family hydrolase